MKTKFTILLFSLYVIMGNAQTKDTVASIKNQDILLSKQFVAPVALIVTGALLLNTKLNDDLQTNANRFFGENFHTSTDNYLPFVPVAQIYLGKSFGFKTKNDFKQQTINIVIANAISVSATEIVKRAVGNERPDQSDNLSFPSGHTAIAFTNALPIIAPEADCEAISKLCLSEIPKPISIGLERFASLIR